MEFIEEKINEALREWLWSNGFTEVDIYGLENYCFYDVDEHYIGYSLLESEKNICTWNKFFIEELDCPVEMDIFYTSFLHELGHAMTWDFLTEEEQNFPIEGLSNEEYFHLPKEIAASNWAIEFIRTNLPAVEDLVNSVDKIFLEIENLFRD